MTASPPLPSRLFQSVREAFVCLTLGGRDALKPGVLWRSLQIWLLVLVFWGTVLFIWRQEIWQAAQTGLSLLAMGLAMALFSPQGGVGSVAGMAHAGIGMGALVVIGALLTQPPVGTVITGLVILLVFMLLASLSVRVLTEFLLMGRVQAQCRRRYPELENQAPMPWLSGLMESAKLWVILLVGGLMCLLVPLLGGLLLAALCAYLNARSLVGEALDGVASPQEQRAFVRSHRMSLLLLGLALPVLLLVPLVGLLAPGWLGASVCHLGMRHLQATRA
ncbi:MAG: EI24 domain-containing protein [Inhella sp.]